MKIFYTGIGAGKCQFFTRRTFYAMVAKSEVLQSIIQCHNPDQLAYTELDLAIICNIIGASLL